MFFFGEASLAHETGRTLQDCGDSAGAERELRRSVRLRKASSFKRTHAVTLGYLGQVQADQGNIDEACATWSAGLEAMDGVHSARARQTVVNTRTALGSFAANGHKRAAELDQQVAFYLATTS